MPRRYVELDRNVAVGERLRIAVVETSPGYWQVEVDGRPVTASIYLPGSWRGVATGESWARAAQPCNRYAFRFEQVSGAGATAAFSARAS